MNWFGIGSDQLNLSMNGQYIILNNNHSVRLHYFIETNFQLNAPGMPNNQMVTVQKIPKDIYENTVSIERRKIKI